MIDAIITKVVVVNDIEPGKDPVVIVHLAYQDGNQKKTAIEHLTARPVTAGHLEAVWKNRKAKIKITNGKITEIRA